MKFTSGKPKKNIVGKITNFQDNLDGQGSSYSRTKKECISQDKKDEANIGKDYSKDYRPETYIKHVSGFCTKINATRAVCKDIKINNFLQNIMYLMKRYVL